MTHLDAVAQAIGYAMMVAGGVWCAGWILAAALWPIAEHVIRRIKK